VSIYKQSEIRGAAAGELTPELYRAWGCALGQRVAPMAKFLVGGDGRPSTPGFLAALRDGLCDAGADVVDLGLLPTPMIRYAQHRLRAAACAVVTASHHPADLNGLWWSIGNAPPTPAEVKSLKKTAGAKPRAANRKRSAPRTLDVSFDYVASLQETWVDAMGAQCHVVLDPMHGSLVARARRYLHAIFPQCLFTAIHDAPEAGFGGRTPDCSQPHLLDELCDAVYRERAHLGVAFDGDGDCVAIVDDQGMPLSTEETAWLLLQSFGHRLRGERVVCDVRLSDRVRETAQALGAEPIAAAGDPAAVAAAMQQTQALFGAEAGGHYFFRVWEGGNDGLFTACWLIAYLAQAASPLSALRRECPAAYITPDLSVPVALRRQGAVLEEIRGAWAKFLQDSLDGLRIDTPGGWALVRTSASEPAMTFRFESVDWHGLNDLVHRFCESLTGFGDELRSRYQAAMGTAGQRET
jgi:phosphomannomutase/phosphoglucomutase